VEKWFMKHKLLDGKALSNELMSSLSDTVKLRVSLGKSAPCLAIIMVGNVEASRVYVKNKIVACKNSGVHNVLYDLPEQTSTKELLNLIKELNFNESISGIIVQLPLPKWIDTDLVIKAISAYKDVDGFHPYNLGRLIQRIPLLRPCTPYGIIQLLKAYKINLKGKNSVIVGASNIVGRPMAIELLNNGSTVTVCHRFTQNLKELVKQAELLVVAVGKPQFVKGSWLKKDAIVIDVGINRLENGSIVGDVDFSEAVEIAQYITPVPGGVGPMTIAALLQNTLLAQSLLEETL
jgi:methylenetetrahydrofolate dehydrogenase (NADP+) / methenyltetrahydrofolate cyclohydrolase